MGLTPKKSDVCLVEGTYCWQHMTLLDHPLLVVARLDLRETRARHGIGTCSWVWNWGPAWPCMSAWCASACCVVFHHVVLCCVVLCCSAVQFSRSVASCFDMLHHVLPWYCMFAVCTHVCMHAFTYAIVYIHLCTVRCKMQREKRERERESWL